MINLRYLFLVLIFGLGSGYVQCSEFDPITPENVETALEQLTRVPEEGHSSETFCHRAAAINRLLLQLSSDERYRILEAFTFPEGSQEIQSVTAICDFKSPPKEFARQINQRPRNDVFAIPSVANVDGLFSTPWLLVESAKDLGRLRVLSNKVETLSGPRSRVLRTLLLVSQSGNKDEVRSMLEEFAKEQAPANKQAPSSEWVLDAAVLSCVCRELDNCSDVLELIRNSVVARQTISPTTKALFARTSFSSQDMEQLTSFRINEDWIAVGDHASLFSNDDHVTHLAGGNAYYVYRYPLAGDFRFQVQHCNPSEVDDCRMQFAGRTFGLKKFLRPKTNLRELDVAGDRFRHWVNGYRLGEFPNDSTCPWIALYPNSNTIDRFRSMRLTGSPTIPREVKLIGTESFAGWTASDPAIKISASSGILESAKSPSSRQQLVRHVRPLQSGETFEYEFFASDQHIAHLAIGRLTFLLAADGVELHWVTASEDDWTGLKVDNELNDPLNRRGPKPLPIRPNDWNRVSLTLSSSKLQIRLNDTLVYSRGVQSDDDTRFGWYHDPSKQAIRVRNATLRGDWPLKLDVDSIAKSRGIAESGGAGAPTDLAKHVFLEPDIRDSVHNVIEEASALTPENRYDYLSKWVLPSEWHSTLRLASDFTALHPPRSTTKDENDRGGGLISPAIELIDVAEKLMRLDELVESTASYAPTEVHQKRNRAAMLALIHHRLSNRDETSKHVETLYRLNNELDAVLATRELWPDFLVSRELISEPDFLGIVRDLLTRHQLPRLDSESPITYELNRLWSVIRQNELEEFAERPRIQLNRWLPTARYHSKQRSLGQGETKWLSIPGGVRHVASHADDLLFYESPLEGNYQLQFERQNTEFSDIQLLAGGTRTEVVGGEAVITGDDDLAKVKTLISPPLNVDGLWSHHRYVVRNGIFSVYVDGRKAHERKVIDGYPWLALHAPDISSGAVRNLQIQGTPTIPSSVNLVHPRMPGWRSYYSFPVNDANGTWDYQGDSIVGPREDFPKGCGRERMLFYQRPLNRSDAVQYEFFFEPGSKMVHPALDRTAFVIGTDAVGLHYITDGRDDKTFHDKTNLRFDPTEQRERPGSLLQENQWNTARVSQSGDQIELQLNGTVVYQHKFSPINQRLFGFFYFSDQSAAQVRNVVLHGSWPKDLPAEFEQPLSDPQLIELNASRGTLNDRMLRNFGQQAIPDKLFVLNGATSGVFVKRPDGLELTVPGAAGQKQSGIVGRFKVSGDFDISADFQNFQPELGDKPSSACSVRLDVVFDGEDLPRGTIQRFRLPSRQTVNGTFTVRRENGGDQRAGQPIDWESNSGTLRIARRGDKMFMLIKDDGALGFRLFRTHQVPTTSCNQIRLMSVAANAKATNVVWKNLDVRADDIASADNIAQADVPTQKVIVVVNADGSNLREIKTGFTKTKGFNNSPHLSPDGKRIVFHSGTGRPSLSNVFIVNSDGTGLKDLGPGSLPNWSPDGKRIAFCSPPFNLAFMNPDGSDRQIIFRNGWALQVSPDGKEVLFKDFGAGGRANITVMDLKTRQKRVLLSGEANRYTNAYWNAAWSPDGQWISFYGSSRITGKHEFAVVSTEGSDHGFRVLMADADKYYPRTSWHPDGDRILIGLRSRNQKIFQYILKLSDQDYCEPLCELTNRIRAEPAAWSTDGSQIVFMDTVAEK